MPHDLIFRDALIFDGTGAPGVQGDVAVEGDLIVAVGAVTGEGRTVVDAKGLAISPGFIDVHTHDDFAVVLHPDMAFKTAGGVTTVIVGNCGMGAAPHASAMEMVRAFHPGHSLPAWEGYRGYLDLLDAAPAAVNVAALIGHGTVRSAAMGRRAGRPTGAELSAMKALVQEGLDAGAVGLSTGLIYEPGRHADTEN